MRIVIIFFCVIIGLCRQAIKPEPGSHKWWERMLRFHLLHTRLDLPAFRDPKPVLIYCPKKKLEEATSLDIKNLACPACGKIIYPLPENKNEKGFAYV